MLADLVKQVGGDRVNVTGLMGPGVDPHLYKPTSADVTRLHSAKVIFYNGLLLEGRMTETFQRLAKRGKKVHAVASAIHVDKLLKPAGFEGHADPHVWGDAEIWASCIETVVKALSDVDGEGAQEYAARGKKYRDELGALHAWARETVATIPAQSRVLITSHDAFNYFGRAYGFEVVGVQGISTATEAGLADVAKVVDLIKNRGIKAIFVESSVPRATIERISKDSGATIGGELFSDALGTPGKMHTLAGQTYDEGTYTGMLKHNVLTAVEALK
jgi:manganese/zinc/iron transport system substrate-binding protein